MAGQVLLYDYDRDGELKKGDKLIVTDDGSVRKVKDKKEPTQKTTDAIRDTVTGNKRG